MQRRRLGHRLVGHRVLPGVIDQGQVISLGGQDSPAGHELVALAGVEAAIQASAEMAADLLGLSAPGGRFELPTKRLTDVPRPFFWYRLVPPRP